jgi:hypothetical protein
MYVDPNPKQLFISQNPRTRNNYFLLFLTTTTTFIYMYYACTSVHACIYIHVCIIIYYRYYRYYAYLLRYNKNIPRYNVKLHDVYTHEPNWYCVSSAPLLFLCLSLFLHKLWHSALCIGSIGSTPLLSFSAWYS